MKNKNIEIEKGHTKSMKPIPVNAHLASQTRKCRFDLIQYDEILKLEDLDSTSFVTLDSKLGNGSPPFDLFLPGSNRTVMEPLHLHASKAVVIESDIETNSTILDDNHANDDGALIDEAELLLDKLLYIFDDDFRTLGHIYDKAQHHDEYIKAIVDILAAEKQQ